MSGVLEAWEKSHYLSLTLWDIDLQFQKANEAYEDWLSTQRRRRSSKWDCFGISGNNDEDELQRALCLGRRVKEFMEKGIEAFGTRFEKGDSKCNAIVSAQLTRAQHEIHAALLNHSLSRTPAGMMPFDDILTAAKAVRRTCLQALRDQFTRLQSPPKTAAMLPLPRFNMDFCPFASQIQRDRLSSFSTKKAQPYDRHDEREVCPCCAAVISVSKHSGLSQYRQILFKSHLAPNTNSSEAGTTFACTSCYKTFDDSFGFLDHVYQKEIGSDKSCQMRQTFSRDSSAFSIKSGSTDSDPAVVERCLRSCLRRELARQRTILQRTKELENPVVKRDIKRDSIMSNTAIA
ncbi:hypothetical protein BU24DRAFT_344229 [Aaosphaeria arxii CBS 175.79]|uniref:C2H2-type domain-containing protein n=1 Tax=Aaosphaeria arxii CBS 175.79 TaxID=1450172 RepID=A0A6A5XU79_9PLEO|nr:uncharacterized protein BU24DRAFT_344229 [Aaosphaeria arxii CBS 175.79]KAF2016915.1 hypothetical protein BU24DRAFT_344229 [Aaosphaeria arxii CBS 175.79]